MNFIIKDTQGRPVQSRAGFSSYACVAREMLSVRATLPLTVWIHDTVSGLQAYDADRTRRLSNAIVTVRNALAKVQS